jgi:non-specific serine/threonine protein kinase
MSGRSQGEITKPSSDADAYGASTSSFRLHTLIHPGYNLPLPLTRFIGREGQIAEVQRLLRPISTLEEEGGGAGRLLTLIGPGGCGKTRLAIEAARGVLKEFADGVGWIELAALTDPDLVPQTVAITLGIRDQPGRLLMETLSDALQHRQMLLVLDNCEHLLAACGRLAVTLLRTCPRLHVLVTSRSVLNVIGEIAWPVPPLAAPNLQSLFPNEAETISLLYQNESVRLFVDRAASALPGFTLTDQNFAAIAQICHRLDGIPLAVELTAARVRVLTTQQIAARLDRLFRLLTRGDETDLPRHQTLRATVDWSYQLLKEKDRILLRRLSVFAGGFSLTAAEAVCAGEGLDEAEILDALSNLVDQSLVLVSEREPHEEARYRMLEMIRQYGEERLMEAGETEWARERILTFFLRLAEEAEPNLRSTGVVLWLRRLDAELDNMRESLTWSLTTQNAEAGLRLAAALWLFWEIRGFFSEGRGWLERSIAIGGSAPSWARAKAFSGLGTIAWDQGDFSQSRVYHQEALDLYRQVGDPSGRAFALNCIGAQFIRQGEHEQAARLLNEAQDVYQELGDARGMAAVLNNFGWLVGDQGDIERAIKILEQGLTFARQAGDKRSLAIIVMNLGELAYDQGEYKQAVAYCEEALSLLQELGEKLFLTYIQRILGDIAQGQGDLSRAATFFRESLIQCRQMGDKYGLIESLAGLARIIHMGGNLEATVKLLGAVHALRTLQRVPMPPSERGAYDHQLGELRAGMGETAFTQAWAAGQAMTLEKAIDLAASLPISSARTATRPEPAIGPARLLLPREASKQKYGGLTPKEREVAALVAQGKSNREIAKELFVGLKTVEAHLTRILSKLGFSSRAQIAAWAVGKGLAEAPTDLDTLTRGK